MKRIFLIAILSIVLVDCNSTDSTDSIDNNEYKPKNIDFIQIAKGYVPSTPFPNTQESKNIVITDNETWKDLIKEIIYPKIDDYIDFEKYEVICVFDKTRPSGAYSIEINSITENQSNIVVKIKTSKHNGFDVQIITQPFHIVEIPKSDKPLVFE